MKLLLILLTTLLGCACGGLPEPGPPLRPEHPRPAMERAQWLNLSGVWAFQTDIDNQGLTEDWAQDPPRFDSTIRVPYPWQNEVEQTSTVGWYRRAFTLPVERSAQAVWLRMEAVGGEAQVWIDGQPVGSASAGFHPTEFDVSDLLTSGTESEIIIRVEDVPGSSQSGLIGTVWLEGRPRTYVSALDFRALQEGVSWAVEVHVAVQGSGGTVDVAISSADPDVGEGRAAATIANGSGEALIRLPVANARTWSPASPRLYPMTVRVTGLGDEVDVVQTTFGLRSVEQAARRILVNDRPQYFRGIAAPQRVADTDEDLRAWVERIKTLGFNLVYAPTGAEPRLHHWADRLGVWTLGADETYSGPSSLRGVDIEVSETGSDLGTQPLLISVGAQPEQGLPQFFRDFTNRVRRLDFAQGYVWGAAISDETGFGAVVPEMTAVDLQGSDYVGIGGAASFEAKPGDKLTLYPFVSRFSDGDEPLSLKVALRAVNDLGGGVEFFSTPRRLAMSPGEVMALEPIVMSVPPSRSLAGTLAFELRDESGRRVAANYASLLVRAFDTPASPRSELFAPRRTALRVDPGAREDAQPVEYKFPMSPALLAAKPTAIEVKVELSAGPARAHESVVRVMLNGRPIGEVQLPDAPKGPAAFLGVDLRYGYLVNLSLELSDDDLAELQDTEALSLRLEPVQGGFTVFGERSGRYVIDPTVIVVTESVPGSVN